MSHLLDVNFLLACGWSSHAKHAAARAWLEAQADFTLCPLSELGFLRVSLSPGYRATFADALAALASIASRQQARFVSADLPAAKLPALSSHADVTDAYFIELARAHGLRLATLDDGLCRKLWATGIAENPL
ncbi:MAG: TA system VapC family ribonuclease toxin [Verrucomicrobiota bacterium]